MLYFYKISYLESEGSHMNQLNVNILRKISASLFATIFLLWAFFQNQLLGKAILCPFLICSISIFLENLFILFKKEKIATFFSFLFRISLFLYILFFLIFFLYSCIKNQDFSLLMIGSVFSIMTFFIFKRAFSRKNR